MATRFWVGGAGTWDSSTTTHWAATTGGTGGQSVPGSSDTVTFDGSSGGGTVTVNTTVTVQSITCGAFTGTLDFSANNNNVTLSAAAGMNLSGSGTRSIKLGNGTWNLTATGNATVWTATTTTGLTFAANSSTIEISGTGRSNARTFIGGGLTYNNLQVDANVACVINSANTFNNISVAGGAMLDIPLATTQTATSLSFNGSAGSPAYITSSSVITAATISVASGTQNFSWSAVASVTFSGGGTFNAYNSFDLGNNSGVTITPPNVNAGNSYYEGAS